MGKVTSLIVSMLVFGLFWFLWSFLEDYEIGGYDLPFGLGHIAGWKPFEGLTQPILIVGGLFSVIVFFLLSRKTEVKN